ncbi:late embryogenesis abundant protein 2-like [Senna tora]|uniref:Late embryogenesis abundant protein 2-like n=1 Tax=Senna tora TaxID=362788 RepID=A0A834T302_9FABA|nr:late embryogenesis abundant protein 2-like [Senna tora]
MASHDQRQTFRAGETKGRTEEKTNQMMSNIGDKAQAAKDKTGQMAHSAKEKVSGTGQPNTANESAQSGGMGQRVKGMAQSASESVKETFGMGQDNHKPRDYN